MQCILNLLPILEILSQKFREVGWVTNRIFCVKCCCTVCAVPGYPVYNSRCIQYARGK